jgi:hypothetical protein
VQHGQNPSLLLLLLLLLLLVLLVVVWRLCILPLGSGSWLKPAGHMSPEIGENIL